MSTIKTYGQNKRPFVLSPPPISSFSNSQGLAWQQQWQSEDSYSYDRIRGVDQDQAIQERKSGNVRLTPLSGTSSTSSSPSIHRSAPSMPMPHFRAQSAQPRPRDSSYMRRFYSSTSMSSSTSSLAYSASSASSPSASISPAGRPIMDRKRQSGESTTIGEKSRAALESNQDVTSVSTQLGRLLIATKQHVRGLLDSLIYENDFDAKSDHPHLEPVLVELLNGILNSHSTFATRNNISSQEQPMTFRPVVLLSLAHLRELMSVATTPALPGTTSEFTPGFSTAPRSPASHARFDGGMRQRSSPLPPSRLSTSMNFFEREDVENAADTDVEVESAQMRFNTSASPFSKESTHSTLHEEAAEMYNSTVEFLALMTAFVSVVCWIMQVLLDNKAFNQTTEMHDSNIKTTMRADEGSYQRGGSDTIPLKEFLSLFNDQDNVLKPIADALAGKIDHYPQYNDMDPGDDPMRQAGLYAWHFYLFASNPEDPLVKDGQAIAVQRLQAVHFDVILNELYTTHILSTTAKEHQKDHGQFYTPPGVVEFMWNRSTRDYGNMLDKFVETIRPRQYLDPENIASTKESASRTRNDGIHSSSYHRPPQNTSQNTPLIPSALDPCLGVSTFLSGYIRLLIQEARVGHDGIIWNSETASRLLLQQICKHVWGIELDGFAFWMARCGVLAALMPLVQRVRELSRVHFQDNRVNFDSNIPQPRRLDIPRLHLFRNDTLQLTLPNVVDSHTEWEHECILLLRNPTRLQFDFIVTNPPYMIRKTGTFSAPDPTVYDWSILGSSFATGLSASSTSIVDVDSSAEPLKGLKAKQGRKGEIFRDPRNRMDEGGLSMTDTGDESEPEVATPGSSASIESASSIRVTKTSLQLKPGSKGMMQAYGYFILFAAQRVKPYTGVSCMITASQWLTLGFASKLRAWLFENCLMDEFFQFEPFKVFSKVQTDSLIFKIRALESSPSSPAFKERILQDHSTIFLRHTDHHKSLAGILQDYMEFSISSTSVGSEGDLNIMVSSKTRQELSVAIASPPSNPSASSAHTTELSVSNSTTSISAWTYSFAPMMPSSGLTTYLLSITQNLGGICSAGTKKLNRLSAVEPLLWHRGPNTNPVYGLVTRMEYARANFGDTMTDKWFRPALYWNGKNSPEDLALGGGGEGDGIGGSSAASRTTHKEALFWQSRDRMRLSKKEASPAESYLVPKPDPQRQYALCMIDKESVKALKQQVELGVDGALKLWRYLTDVRNHFQPGLASKKRNQSVDEGVAFCSTNQCGSDVSEKIIHPINYGYFSKTQPRQRFFLDNNSHAVTNQCIYLTLNILSSHYNAQQSPPLIYFLVLLNSSTLQFFILHHCQYDQQGRMRLFRESMAKIPFQDQDVKSNPDRARYASKLGEFMIELKDLLYQAASSWRLSGSHRSHGHDGIRGNKRGGSAVPGKRSSKLGEPLHGIRTTSSGGNGLLDWIRRGGDAPAGVLTKTKEQIRNMLMVETMTETMTATPTVHQKIWFPNTSLLLGTSHSGRPSGFLVETDTDTNTSTDTDTDTDDNIEYQSHITRTHPISSQLAEKDRASHPDNETAPRDVHAWQSDLQDPYIIPYESSEYSLYQGRHYDSDTDQIQDSPVASKVIDSIDHENEITSIHSGHRLLAPSFASGGHLSSVIPVVISSLEPIATSQSRSETDNEISKECDRIVQAIERAVSMIEVIQWAVDQYGYMLYGIEPKFQKLLELELKLVHGSIIEALVVPTSPTSSPFDTATSDRIPGFSTSSNMPRVRLARQEQQTQKHQEQTQSQFSGATVASRLGITLPELHRWSGVEEDDNSDRDDNSSKSTCRIPSYAESVLENARMAVEDLKDMLQRYPCLPVENMTM
ncbi:hypothetical protein BGX27_010529 [Mortierella sp. AM989]|nr:hypothetical protein BGX27_010529 [Mortierella sp. AM989]